MSALRRSKDGKETRPSADADEGGPRLGGIAPMSHDDDERPRREDMDYGQTIFTRRPVPLPRWLRGRRDKSP